MDEISVIMRMGENGEDGEMLSAHPTRALAERKRRFMAQYDGEDMLRLEIFTVPFEA